MQDNTLLSAIMVQLSPKPYRHPLNMDAYCYEQWFWFFDYAFSWKGGRFLRFLGFFFKFLILLSCYLTSTVVSIIVFLENYFLHHEYSTF